MSLAEGDRPNGRIVTGRLPCRGWEIDELLGELGVRCSALYRFGPRDSPDTLVAVLRRGSVADVVAVRGERRAAAYRSPVSGDVDPLRVDRVVWHYLGSAVRTLRAVLSLPEPRWGPVVPYPVPDECRIPEAERRPMTITVSR